MIRDIIKQLKEKKGEPKKVSRKDNPNKPTKLHNKHIPNRPLAGDILKKFGRP